MKNKALVGIPAVIAALLIAFGISKAGGSHVSTTTTKTITSTTSTASTSTPIVQKISCFSSPSSCGYPSPASGVSDCSSLPSWSPSDLPAGDVYYTGSGNQANIQANNVTIKGYNIGNWLLYVSGVSGFTLDGDCVAYNGSSFGGGQNGSQAVWGTSSSSAMTVENSTLIAPGCAASATTTCNGPGVDETLITGGPDTTVKNDVLAGAVEPINGLGAGSVVENSYIVANGIMSGSHNEVLYENGISGGITVSGNTILNPFDQSGVIYGDDSNVSCSNVIKVTNNLIAGGGYPFQTCAINTQSLTVTGNDFARCTNGSTYDPVLGGHYCGSSTPTSADGSSIGHGQDIHGYWPEVGFFGLNDLFGSGSKGCSAVTWSNNTYDDNGAPAPCS